MIRFEKDMFLSYMAKQFTPMDSHFTYGLVSNVVDMAVKRFPNDAPGIRKFLSETIPELRPEEIDPFLRENT